MAVTHRHSPPGRLPVAAFLLMLLSAIGAAADEAPLCFTILHTNDEHSALLPEPLVDYRPGENGNTTGGFARLSRLVGGIREAKSNIGEPVVLVSAGDIVGGSPYYWLVLNGETPEISLMQQIGYDVITIGNHDFDYGPEILARYFLRAGYPQANASTAVVTSNLVIPPDHPLADCGFLNTHVIVLDNGLRLGFFGLLGKNAAKLAALKAPIDISDPIAAALAAVKSLRDMNADVIIGVTHAGRYEDEAVAAAVPGIDVMVTGHFHPMALDAPLRVDNTILVQSNAYAQTLGMLELAYTRADRTLRIRNEESGQPFLIPINDSIEEDPAVSKRLAGYTDTLNRLVKRLTNGKVSDIHDTVICSDFVLRSSPPGRESILGNFVTDAMRLIVEQRTGEEVDFAIQANGVIRGDVAPGSMPHSLGRICFYDLASAIGLGVGYDGNPGYPLVSIYLTGNEIYRMLEITLWLAQHADVFFLQISGGRFSLDPRWVAPLRIPFTKWSLPTFRAVLGLEKFAGKGLQAESDEAFQPIPRGDDTLYHVVCDSYVLSFFPKVAELLPFYKVIPKDRHGKPIALRDAIIHDGDGELKFWQAVVDYALEQSPGNDGIPRMPAYYALSETRIIQTHKSAAMAWAMSAAALAFALFSGFSLWKWRRKKRHKTGETGPAPLTEKLLNHL